MLSSDCGFGRQSMSRMHAFYKMVALSRGANIVRKELGIAAGRHPRHRSEAVDGAAQRLMGEAYFTFCDL